MKIVKYTYVDVYYTKEEKNLALKLRKKLIRIGYELQVEDIGSDSFDYCDQYLGHESIKFKKP
jgi:hypothetical protein